MKKYLLLLFSILLFASCRNSQYFLKKTFKNSEVFKQNFTGFSLIDLSNNQIIFEKNADKYFQPASNNKLFTLYAGLKTLGDSVPALHYLKKGDSLIIWGTGDPSLLHPDLPRSTVIDFLKNRPEKLYFSNSNTVKEKFGPGWMLEDYNEYYQAEITALPIYGNIVRFTKKQNQIIASPETIITCILDNDSENTVNQIIRSKDDNCFQYFDKNKVGANYLQDVPFITSDKLLIDIFKAELNRNITGINEVFAQQKNTIYSIKCDSLYKRMLLVSDNMMAEQIIILASKSDTLSTSKSISNILKMYLGDIPDKPRWVDGSGLSRYNLTTPRNLTHVLKKIYGEIPGERLYDVMPKIKEGIFAKSGSYSNNYNLSGYLIGQSGKTFAFSCMNNNYMRSTSEIKKEVLRILLNLKAKL
jgi:serine-type D-Ala-D-Ala carboxypeptidase/endopeptidase (penicillin-binding protein 4)